VKDRMRLRFAPSCCWHRPASEVRLALWPSLRKTGIASRLLAPFASVRGRGQRRHRSHRAHHSGCPTVASRSRRLTIPITSTAA